MNELLLARTEDIQSLPDALLMPKTRIKANPLQPRQEWDVAKIKQIAENIKTLRAQGRGAGGTGILQPILVRWEPGAFNADGSLKPDACAIIIAGETRWRAAMMVEDLDGLPVIVTDQDSEAAYEDSVTENILRGDLTPVDEGRVFQYLKNKHNISSRTLAVRLYSDVGRHGYIENRLDMLKLSDIVRPLIDQRADSLTAARRIQTLKNEDQQRELVEFMLNGGGTFKTLNARIQKIKGLPDSEEKEAQKRDRENREALEKAFGNASQRSGQNSGTSQGTTPSHTPARSDDSSTKDESEKTPVELAQEVKTALDDLIARTNALATILKPPARLDLDARRALGGQVTQLRLQAAKVEEALRTE